jgi:hypothetical protein
MVFLPFAGAARELQAAPDWPERLVGAKALGAGARRSRSAA